MRAADLIEGRGRSCCGAEVESFYHLNDCSLAGTCCNGMACFVARHLNQQLWARAEQQHPRLYCLGQCFAGPAIAGAKTRPHIEVRSRKGVVLERIANGAVRTLSEYKNQGGYRALETALTIPLDQIVPAIEASALRGRGGAAFPTGRKWRAVLAQPTFPKYVIANADEGDPGAYIDRFLLEDDPFALLEGMSIAAHAVGATKGWVYLRAEYPTARPILEAAIAEARTAGLLGDRVLGRDFSFDVEVFVGQGSYICGEETALIGSLEGRRPEVMARPPYPTEHGLFGKPTLVNNVETFVSVPWIIANGGEAYHSLGFSKSRGTKVVSLNSLFQRPGLYEIEFGVTVREIVEELGGGLRESRRLKGVLIGGPLAGIIPPHLFDTPFGFEELRDIGASVGHGGVIGFDEKTSVAQLVHHVFSFGAYESCGKCTPCRLGSRRMEDVFAAVLREGAAHHWDETDYQRIIAALKMTSLCGHGIGLGEFAESVLSHYGKELESCFR